MAYNTKNILTDVGSKPIPQFYDPADDVFRQLTGANVDTGRYAADHIAWGKTAAGIYIPLQVDVNGQLQVDVLTTPLPADAATQTTLAAILAKIIAAPSTAAKQDTIIGHVDGVETALASILAKIIAAPSTEAKQDTILTKLIMGAVTAAPVVGVKTITATAAEIFAGASVKASRRMMRIRNEDPALRLRIGPSTVTQQNGYVIEPGGTIEIQFDPATAVAIYGISEGAALSAGVLEV